MTLLMEGDNWPKAKIVIFAYQIALRYTKSKLDFAYASVELIYWY